MIERAQGTPGRLVVALATMAALALMAAGCVKDTGLLVILQNQQPQMDSTTLICSAGSMPSAVAVGAGVLDLAVPDAFNKGYIAYPLVQSRLPSRADTPGGTDPNTVYLQKVSGTLRPPAGVTVDWPAGCSDQIDAPGAAALIPGGSLGMNATVISPCQAQVIYGLFVSKALPPDLSQQVVFSIDMQVVGSLSSGDQVSSDVFHFSIRTCVGCLQTGYPDVAPLDWPNRPPCSAAPKPNLYHGNPCNMAQDYGPLLCCTDDLSQPVCPAPDM